jgi:hypothetical protein
VQVRSFFLLLVMLMRDASGRFKPMRVGRHTGILGLRASMHDIIFYGEKNVLNVEGNCFRKL